MNLIMQNNKKTNDKPNQPPTEQEHKLKTNDIPCRLIAAEPSKPVHEVSEEILSVKGRKERVNEFGEKLN